MKCYVLPALLICTFCFYDVAHAAAATATAGTAQNCLAITAKAFLANDPTAEIELVKWHDTTETVETSVAPGMTAAAALPGHCEVIGSLQHRSGLHGQNYAVRFHMRLPAKWNGRFVFQGGGGSNGALGDALGRIGSDGSSALGKGYAVVSQDSGHDNSKNSDPAYNGELAFGFDPVARANYGHLSLKIVADTAKSLITGFYGKPARYSYFIGCSKGGQEGMTFAQLYPDEFDGIIAAAPGFSLPRAAVAEAWDVQAFASLVTSTDGGFDPANLRLSVSPEQFTVLRSAILKACDGNDGLVDGIVGDIYSCTDAVVLPQLEAVTCKNDSAPICLTTAQISVFRRVIDGPRNASGRSLYASWFWPAGVEGDGWRMWKIGSSDGRIPPLNVVLGGASLAAVFTTPPTSLPGTPQALAHYQLTFDFDRDAPGIYSVAAPFATSAWHDVGSRSPDLQAFHARRGRMIVPHGDSDPVFSLKDTLNWYDEVNTVNHGRAAEFVRVFPVPGMCHCGGGQATDNFDAFTALVEWVERGTAPESLLGVAGPGSPWPGRRRPICAYPKVARYLGNGNPEIAASFECRQ